MGRAYSQRKRRSDSSGRCNDFLGCHLGEFEVTLDGLKRPRAAGARDDPGGNPGLNRAADFRPENRSPGDVSRLDIPVQLGFDQAVLNQSMLTDNVEWKSQAERHSRLDVIPRGGVCKGVEFPWRRTASFFDSPFHKIALVRHDQDTVTATHR